MPRAQAPAVLANGSWMAPGAGKGALIYAPGDEASYVLTYPTGRLVGKIAMTGFGSCSDAGGNVFFGRAGEVVEFAHAGTTPIATYAVPGSAYSCSVDPANGNLAVVVLCFTGCGNEVVVFSKRAAAISQSAYHVHSIGSLLFCAYDDKGNLFVDGFTGSKFGLARLGRGKKKFTAITLDRNIQFATQIQWDGKYLAVQTRIRPAIYQLQFQDSVARVAHIVRFDGIGQRAMQSWIQKGKIAFPTSPSSGRRRAIEIRVWAYPKGGPAIDTIDGFIGGGHQMLDSVTFSVAPNR